MKTIIALAVVAFLAACSQIPKYELYKPELATSFVNQPADALPAEPAGQFWHGFGDAQLDSLIERSLGANAELRIAQANLREARALSRFADAQLAPTVDVVAGATRTRARDLTQTPQTFKTYNVGFDVNWEVDLFGRLSDESRAAAADVLAGEAGVRFAQISVRPKWRANRAARPGRLRVAHGRSKQQAVLDLVQARQGGSRTGFDPSVPARWWNRRRPPCRRSKPRWRALGIGSRCCAACRPRPSMPSWRRPRPCPASAAWRSAASGRPKACCAAGPTSRRLSNRPRPLRRAPAWHAPSSFRASPSAA
jgi:hypothetical protein